MFGRPLTEPTRAQPLLVSVDDLDGGRQLVRIDPDDDVFHVLLPPVLVPIGTARWAVLLRAGQSPLEPRLVTVSGGPQTDREPHHERDGQPQRERPAGTWTESGQTSILREVSSSRK